MTFGALVMAVASLLFAEATPALAAAVSKVPAAVGLDPGQVPAPVGQDVGPSPSAVRPDGPESALAEARRLINQRRIPEALERLAPLDPADPQVPYLRGVAHYHADDHAQAITDLRPVVSRLAPGSVERREAVQVLGLSLYLTGRLADAVPYLEETREWARDNLELAYVLGNAYAQTQRPEKARGAYAQLFGVSPDTAAGHLVTAQMMVRLEQEDLADAELRQAIAKDPRIPQAHYLLGQAAIFRGRFAEARELLEKELAQNPAHAMALYRLGDAFTREARWDEAIAALQKSIWLQPHFSGPYILLGRSYMKKGQPATAEGMLRRAIQYDPNNKAAHYLLGQLLQQTGRGDEAQREFLVAEKLQAEPERR
jgi:tetratricopeptide (TPR) repeat protein